MRELDVGDLVTKNPETWIPNDFDSWGRGEGVGVVVVSELPLEKGEVDVRWPGGRCFELDTGLTRLSPSGLKPILEQVISLGSLGKDRAQEIESLISLFYPEEHEAHALADLLAQYSPGGGEMLFSEKQIIPALERFLLRLNAGFHGAVQAPNK